MNENVKYYVGSEIKHTPAFSKKTLFVVGKQDVVEIEKLARENKTPHISMGAKDSFNYENPGDNSYWDKTITALLDRGFWVTLEYKAHFHDKVLNLLNPGIWQSRIFVPLLSIAIPKIQTSNPNLTVKIDDIDFRATNPGIWCLHFREVTDSNRFTDWEDYVNEEEIITEEKVVVNNIVKKESKINVEKTETTEVEERKEEKIEEIKNNQDLGLDITPKADVNIEINVPVTNTTVAEAYVGNTTQDPLAKSAPKKTRVTKKESNNKEDKND